MAAGGGHGALRWLWLSAAVLAADQLTKRWAVSALDPARPLEVLPFLNLRLGRNPGAAFSLLSDAGGWQRWLFIALAVVVAVGIVIWLARLGREERLLGAALALVLGGALGNLWDRVVDGAVVDFLDLHAAGWHWPAFNLADSAITLGAVILVVDGLWPPGGRQRPH